MVKNTPCLEVILIWLYVHISSIGMIYWQIVLIKVTNVFPPLLAQQAGWVWQNGRDWGRKIVVARGGKAMKRQVTVNLWKGCFNMWDCAQTLQIFSVTSVSFITACMLKPCISGPYKRLRQGVTKTAPQDPVSSIPHQRRPSTLPGLWDHVSCNV